MLEAEDLLAAARIKSGIDRLDADAVVPLQALVNSLNRESRLHEAGETGMRAKLVRILANRLRMQRDYEAHPEIAEETISAPIFLCGMGRTGSTKTQKLLAASGDFNWLSYWQVTNPCLLSGDRGESPQARIDETEDFVRWFDAASPETKFAHGFETHEPEEESFILEQSLMSPVLMGWSPISSYLAWIMSQDMSRQFRYLQDTLKYLQWQGLADHSKPWLLKSPLYSGLEPLLLQTFPDARLLMTHRHPKTTIPSGLKLLEAFHKPFTNALPDPATYVAGQAAAIAAHLQIRAATPGFGIHDIGFSEVIGPVEIIARKLYDYCGLALTSAALENMQAWNAANPQGKNGKHVYALTDYGLSDADIATQFAPYIAFLESRGI